MPLTYAGIGSRKTPPDTLDDMTRMAKWLSGHGWHLNSGGALGADTAFAQGAPVDRRTIYLPFADYNRHRGPDCVVPDPGTMERAIQMASRLHPAWHKCSPTARQMHGRNCTILLGADLRTPVNAVVAWTPGGGVEGGTGMGIRIAREHEIDVLNLGTLTPRQAAERLVTIAQEYTVAPDTPRAAVAAPAAAVAGERAYNMDEAAAFRFTRAEWGEFSNFAPLANPIHAGPWTFPTSEHLYQAAKFTARPDIQARIAAAPTAREAAQIGRSPDLPIDSDWNDRRVDVMRWVLRHKYAANPELIGASLLNSGDRPIVEVSNRDPFWGARQDGDRYYGTNTLGRLWMELRQQIVANAPEVSPEHWTATARIGQLAAPARLHLDGPAFDPDPEPEPMTTRFRNADPGIFQPDPETFSSLAPPHGPTPDPDSQRNQDYLYRVDARDAWDLQAATAGVRHAYASLAELCAIGTPLAGEHQALAHGFVHALKSQAQRLSASAERERDLLNQARGIDRGIHDSHSTDMDTAASMSADQTDYADYRHSPAGLKAHSRAGQRKSHTTVRPDPRSPTAKPALSPTAARNRRMTANTDPDDIEDLTTGYNNIAWRAHALEAVSEMAAECYAHSFRESWIEPLSRNSFQYPKSLDLTYIKEQRARTKGPARVASWLTRWQILNQIAKNKEIPVNEMPAYAGLYLQAERLANSETTAKRDVQLLSAFLKEHPHPDVRAPGPDRAGPAPPLSPPTAATRSRADALANLFDVVDRQILANGTQLAEERDHVLGALTHWLHRERNRVVADIRNMEGRGHDVPHRLRQSLDALGHLAHEGAKIYARHTGSQWIPPPEYADTRTRALTAAAATAEKVAFRHDHAAARSTHVTGTFVAVSGSREWADATSLKRTLDGLREKYPDLVIMHGDGPGAAAATRAWASENGVDQVVYRPQWNRHGRRAAPIRRNEEMLKHKPVEIISFQVPGEPEYLAVEAQKQGIPTTIVTDATLEPGPSQDTPAPTPPPAAPAPIAAAPAPDPEPAPTPAPAYPIPPPEPVPAPTPEVPANGPPPGYATSYTHPAATEALAAHLERHLKLQPPHHHPISDGKVIHYTETPEFQEWASGAEPLFARLRHATDYQNFTFSDGEAHQLLHRLETASDNLTEAIALEQTDTIAADFLDDVWTRKDAITTESLEADHPWTEHPGSPALLERVDALLNTSHINEPDAEKVRAELLEIRSSYEQAIQHETNRKTLDAPSTNPAPTVDPASPAPGDDYTHLPAGFATIETHADHARALSEQIEEHIKAKPAIEHPMVNGRLLHYIETAEFQAWGNRAQQLINQVEHATDYTDWTAIKSDPPPLLARLEAACGNLDHALFSEDTPTPGPDLYVDISSRIQAITRHCEETDQLWVDHPDTAAAIERLDALLQTSHANELYAEPLRTAAHELRSTYNLDVERKAQVIDIDAKLKAHIEARQPIRQSAADQQLLITDVPEWEKWCDRLDDLQQVASDIFENTEAYGAHLKARPDLRSSIKSNLALLDSAQEQDVAIARSMPHGLAAGTQTPEAPKHDITPEPPPADELRPKRIPERQEPSPSPSMF